MDISSGLVALAFWGFVGTCVVVMAWNNIRKRETKHETMRRLVESGATLDDDLLKKLDLLQQDAKEERYDRGFKITALWLYSVGAGLAVFGIFLDSLDPRAGMVMYGTAAMLFVMATGCLVGERITKGWFEADQQ